MDVKWEEPEPRLLSRSVWADRLTPLMERPNAWARVSEAKNAKAATTLASMLRRGRLRAPEGEWEFTTRENRVYARYLGPSTGDAPLPE